MEGPGQLAVQYIFLDPATDEIIKSGSAEAMADNRFRVQMPASEVATLAGDLYHLYLAAYSDELGVGTGAQTGHRVWSASIPATAIPHRRG